MRHRGEWHGEQKGGRVRQNDEKSLGPLRALQQGETVMRVENPGTAQSKRGASAFLDGWGYIPDTPIVAAAIAVLLKAGPRARVLNGGWAPDDGGLMACRHVVDGVGEVMVFLGSDGEPADDPDVDAGWADVETVSPLTLDVLVAILARIAGQDCLDASQRIRRSRIPVTARAILREKGLTQWGARGAVLRRRIDREIKRLAGMRFSLRPSCERSADFGRAAAGDGGSGDIRLFQIIGSRTIQSTRKRRACNAETAWSIRRGQWPAPADRLAAMPQAILQFDHRDNRGSAVLAKKIGLAMCMPWRRSGPQDPLRLPVRELLRALGELPARDARGNPWGSRMRARLGQALLRLREIGLLTHVDLPAGAEPGAGIRRRGRIANWLDSVVILTGVPSGAAARGTAVGPVRKIRRPGRAASGLLELNRGSVIRAMRTRRRLSQHRFARELGISAAYLSQIENEHRMASQAVLARIAGWVQRNDHEADGRAGAIVTLDCTAGRRPWGAAGGQATRRAGAPLAPPDGNPARKDDRT
ncbi:MAG: helix-turn-helix domain-containing protein [Rhodospirillales bacterium]|nr:MAG: helix-turn-helix domain-containing protein [Rhodospirillales bacterium]